MVSILDVTTVPSLITARCERPNLNSLEYGNSIVVYYCQRNNVL